jgi:hypothetical protein
LPDDHPRKRACLQTLEEFILGPSSSEQIVTQHDFRTSPTFYKQNAGNVEYNEATSWIFGKATSTPNIAGFQESDFLAMTVPVTVAVHETVLFDQRKSSDCLETTPLCKLISRDEESKDM